MNVIFVNELFINNSLRKSNSSNGFISSNKLNHEIKCLRTSYNDSDN